MVIYEKKYFEAYTNDQYIWHKNNIAQLYFTLGSFELHWNFSSTPRDVRDIHRFSNRKWILNMWYSQIFQQEVDLKHVQHWKSVNIRVIP